MLIQKQSMSEKNLGLKVLDPKNNLGKKKLGPKKLWSKKLRFRKI